MGFEFKAGQDYFTTVAVQFAQLKTMLTTNKKVL